MCNLYLCTKTTHLNYNFFLFVLFQDNKTKSSQFYRVALLDLLLHLQFQIDIYFFLSLKFHYTKSRLITFKFVYIFCLNNANLTFNIIDNIYISTNMKYSLGYNTWTNQEISAATKTLLSGNYTMGKKVKGLKKICSEIWSQICNYGKFWIICKSIDVFCFKKLQKILKKKYI